MYFSKVKPTFILIYLMIISACRESKTIITPESAMVQNFKEFNQLEIIQIFPKDNLIPPSNYLQSSEFRYASITDSNFKWNKEIYFNKIQKGFKWVRMPVNDSAWVPTYTQPNLGTIGKLRSESWYILKGLSNVGYHLIYFDSKGAAKTYEVNRLNY